MKKERRIEILIVICLSALILIPRLIGLDAFVSVDEPDWLKFGANFYHAIGTGNFASTVYDYHPGVTTCKNKEHFRIGSDKRQFRLPKRQI